MLALRYAALLALVVWVGGLVALGAVAAPAIFDVVAARQVPDGRLLAGAIFGEILRRFHLVSYALRRGRAARRWPRARCSARGRGGSRSGWSLAALMLAAVAYSGLIVSPRIEALQQTIGVAPSSLPDERSAPDRVRPAARHFHRAAARAAARRPAPPLLGAARTERMHDITHEVTWSKDYAAVLERITAAIARAATAGAPRHAAVGC